LLFIKKYLAFFPEYSKQANPIINYCMPAFSCAIKEKSDKLLKEKFHYDSAAVTEPIHSIISRLDGTGIDVSILDQKITSLIDLANVTSLAIAIIKDNQIVLRKAFGYDNKKKKISSQINHSFAGASLSKAVFGYLVSILVTEGVIDLDRPLQQYLDFPLYELNSENKWRGFQ